MTKRPRAPWKRANPKKASGKSPKHLSARQKNTARARAKRAGRHYPNLVDNMRAAAKAPRKTRAHQRGAQKKSLKARGG